MDRSVSPSPKRTTTTTSPSPPLLVPTSPSPPLVVSPPPAPPPPPVPSSPPPPSPVPSVPDPAPGDPSTAAAITGELLPVTNIDDFEVEHHHHHHPAPSPTILKRKGNTFTVVPNRKVESQSPTATNSLEAPQEPSSAGGQPGSTTPAATTQAPYSHLGSQLKKRYPAVEEIEVIGGYLSLGKSCLAKTGSAGKKVRRRPSSPLWPLHCWGGKSTSCPNGGSKCIRRWSTTSQGIIGVVLRAVPKRYAGGLGEVRFFIVMCFTKDVRKEDVAMLVFEYQPDARRWRVRQPSGKTPNNNVHLSSRNM